MRTRRADALKTWLRAAVDLVYPRQCQVCGDTGSCRRFAFLCDSCFEGAPRIEPPWCERCGLAFPGAAGSVFECPNCSTLRLHFDRARAVMRFRGVVRHAVHQLKYSHQTYWTAPLRAWFVEGAASLLDREAVDVAFPVPLHPVRERERGFNQAWVLLEALAGSRGIAADRKGLVRLRKTETQTHFDRAERMANLRDAFEVRRPEAVAGKKVMLVDDVLTTGSTSSECGRVLKQAGAASVLVFTLARG